MFGECQRALTGNRTPSGAAGALERRERRRRGQQLAQHDRSRHADARVLKVELCDTVLAQRGERDPAEVGHRGVLQHHRGQMVGGVARDVVGADTVTQGHTAREWAGDIRDGLPQSVCFLVSGR